jgi:hypothetical protein
MGIKIITVRPTLTENFTRTSLASIKVASTTVVLLGTPSDVDILPLGTQQSLWGDMNNKEICRE